MRFPTILLWFNIMPSGGGSSTFLECITLVTWPKWHNIICSWVCTLRENKAGKLVQNLSQNWGCVHCRFLHPWSCRIMKHKMRNWLSISVSMFHILNNLNKNYYQNMNNCNCTPYFVQPKQTHKHKHWNKITLHCV